MEVQSVIEAFKLLDNYVEFEKTTDHYHLKRKLMLATVMDDLPEFIEIPKDMWGQYTLPDYPIK